MKKNKRLKSELAARPTDDEIQVKLMLAQFKGGNGDLLEQLQGEVETLKSQVTKLQAENTELSTTNNGLTAAKSELYPAGAKPARQQG